MITVNFVVWMRHSNKIIILDNEYSLKWKWKIEEIFEIEPRINVDLTHHKNQIGFVRFVCHVNNDFFFFLSPLMIQMIFQCGFTLTGSDVIFFILYLWNPAVVLFFLCLNVWISTVYNGCLTAAMIVMLLMKKLLLMVISSLSKI